jgi:hypothetical protein
LSDLRDEMQLSGVRIDGTVTFWGDAAREAGSVLRLPADRPEVLGDGIFWLRVPGRCRVDVSSVEGGKTSVLQSHGRTRIEGTELPGLRTALEQVCPILAARSSGGTESRTTLERHLGTLGISLRNTSLARFGGQVAYVIGDEAEGQPQFWIYKDNFLPARVRFSDAQGTAWDVRFLDYTSPATGEWFPRMVEVRRGGEPLLRFTSLKADIRARVDDRLFDTPSRGRPEPESVR